MGGAGAPAAGGGRGRCRGPQRGLPSCAGDLREQRGKGPNKNTQKMPVSNSQETNQIYIKHTIYSQTYWESPL